MIDDRLGAFEPDLRLKAWRWGSVWAVFGKCLPRVWTAFGPSLTSVWDVFGKIQMRLSGVCSWPNAFGVC